MSRLVDRRRLGRIAVCLLMIVWTGACSGSPTQVVLTVNNMLPVHLGEYLDAATIIGSEVPANLFVEPVEWRFDEPQPGWKATTLPPRPERVGLATVSQTDEALEITLGPSTADSEGRRQGGALVDVPAWDARDFAHVEIRARSSGPGSFDLGFNVWDEDGQYRQGRSAIEMMNSASAVRFVEDSTVQTYRVPWTPKEPLWGEPIDQVAIWVRADDLVTVEILSITVVPREAVYAEERAGLRRAELDSLYRRSLFVHTPAQLTYRVEVPHEGRLDTGLGILGSEPTTFRVAVSADGEPPEPLLDVRHSDREAWPQHSLDLSAYAGQVVTLSLEADSARDGSVAFWGAPTITEGIVRATRPMPKASADGAAALRVLFLGDARVTVPGAGGLLQPFEGFCRAEGLACEAVSQLPIGGAQNDRARLRVEGARARGRSGGGSPREFAHGVEFAGLGGFGPVSVGARDERVRALIASGGFDYVVVDSGAPWDFVPAWVDQFPRVGVGRETIEGFKAMHRMIVEAGATTVVTVPIWGDTLRHLMPIVAEGHRRLKAELDAMVIGGTRRPVLLVPLGPFQADATAKFGVEAVYARGIPHPGLWRYADAALVYTYLTGRDPRQNPFAEHPRSYWVPDDTPPELVPDEQAEWVKNHAWWYYRNYR